jgi:hypothetical protein
LTVFIKNKYRERPVQLPVLMRLELSRGSDLVVQSVDQDHPFHENAGSFPRFASFTNMTYLATLLKMQCLHATWCRLIQLWLPLVHLCPQAVILPWY